MFEIEIRPLTKEDIPFLLNIDHSYHTDFAWQMEVSLDERDIQIRFKEVRLPRSMRVDYPRKIEDMGSLIESRDFTYVAHKEDEVIGYACVNTGSSSQLGMITDLAVLRRYRKQGVGSALVVAVQTLLSQKGFNQVQLEMQSKNHPAISLATKLGFDFCGYSDRYFENKDIALFFGRRL